MWQEQFVNILHKYKAKNVSRTIRRTWFWTKKGAKNNRCMNPVLDGRSSTSFIPNALLVWFVENLCRDFASSNKFLKCICSLYMHYSYFNNSTLFYVFWSDSCLSQITRSKNARRAFCSVIWTLIECKCSNIFAHFWKMAINCWRRLTHNCLNYQLFPINFAL